MMNKIEALLMTALVLLPASAALSQGPSPTKPREGETPCSFLTKSEAESILGRNVVNRSDSDNDCWFQQEGYVYGAGPNGKQVQLSINRSASAQPDTANSRRAQIAADQKMFTMTVREVADFADAAIWTWMSGPSAGTLYAFKGGTIEVVVRIAGMPEDAALQNAKKLAARPLGGSGKSGYAYAGAAPGGSTPARAGAGTAPAQVQSPASYSAAWMGQSRVIRGTVSRVSVDMSGIPRWLTIFFKESPDAAFVVCSPYPDMFQETVGDLYTLVGKTLEVTGQVEGSICAGKGKAASIRVVESKAYRVLGLQAQAVATAGGAPRPRPASHPGERRVGLDICNAGKVDFDAFVAKQGHVTSTHIAPRDCEHVYEESGAPPAYVGLAFADSHGQWGAPRRVGLLPYLFGSDNAPTGVWSKADQSVSVKRGTKDVSLPMRLLFSPARPVCTTTQPDSAVASLPWNATAFERNVAEIHDANSPPATTTCNSFDYTLNVVAYPDTREVSFEKKCFECPQSQTPPTSREQRAAEQQGIQTMSRISPLAGRIMGQAADQEEQQKLKESLEGPPEYRRMNWNEMNLALANVRQIGIPPEMPRYLIIRGTVSRVDVSPPQASEHWVNVYFRESPEQVKIPSENEPRYGAFNICTLNQEIFEDMFGPEFRSRMIGQTLEVEGEYQRDQCKGWKGSIRITLEHQVRKVTGIDPADAKGHSRQ